MATSARSSSDFYSTALENYLVAMTRTVEGCVNRSFAALLSRNADIASAVFVTEMSRQCDCCKGATYHKAMFGISLLL